ncbi:MAG: hypothetical protein ABIP13_04250 [Tepidiformaceae bacterium]
MKLLLFAPFALLLTTLSACGGDSDGSYESFSRDLCKASSGLQAGIQKAVKDASTNSDPNKAIETIADPIDAFVKAFDNGDPPKNLKAWHAQSAKDLKQAAETFRKQKDFTALSGFGDSPVPDPPSSEKQKLRDAAKNLTECDGVVFLKPN